MELSSFIAAHGIRMTVDWAPNNPNMVDAKWAESANHYKCVLRCGRRTLTVLFSQGCAISHEPTAADVLDCLASDAAGVLNAHNFEDWCGEYGYDTDSRSAEKTFKTGERQAAGLRRLLGSPDTYETLLFKVDRQ